MSCANRLIPFAELCCDLNAAGLESACGYDGESPLGAVRNENAVLSRILMSIFDYGIKIPYSQSRGRADAVSSSADSPRPGEEDGFRRWPTTGRQDDSRQEPARRRCRLSELGRRRAPRTHSATRRSEEHTSELQSRENLVC